YILQEESELNEIVRLVGMDALGNADRLTMETAKSIREDFLHQNAFHEIDTYTSLNKQHRMMKLILDCYHYGQKALKDGAEINDILSLPVREKIGRSKYIEEKDIAQFDLIEQSLKKEMSKLGSVGNE
ncbi:MAG: V-type ATP synthase subunit A, partial [Clostridia bacterium]